MSPRGIGPRNPRRRGFTVAELVVVVAIVAALAGLLVPALGAAKGAGRRARCASHLRQMALAAQQYAAVYDHWPAAMRYALVDGQFRQIAWDWESGGGALIGPGPLWAFTDDPGEVQQCPDYHGTTNFSTDPHTGYNYNTGHVAGEALFPQVGWKAVAGGTRPHACRRTETCALFGDGGRAQGTNKFMRAPVPHGPHGLTTVYSGGQAFRHLGTTNVAHLDGHVASVEGAFAGEQATDTLLESYLGWPRNGFLSDDARAYDPR